MRILPVFGALLCLSALAPALSLASSPREVIGAPSLSSQPLVGSNYGRSDGTASQAQLYFPAQLFPFGDSLLFSEYSSVERPRYYRLGGAIRSLDRAGKVDTLALSKRMAGTADRMVGLTARGGTAYATLGESIVSLPLPGRQRNFSFPEGGTLRDTVSASVLGSADLPYQTLAGLPSLAGGRDGSGSEARFSYPAALSLWGDYLIVFDRDNRSIRRVSLDSGSTQTLTSTPDPGPAPALVGRADTLYASWGSKGVVSINLSQCLPARCLVEPLFRFGDSPVNGLALQGDRLYASSADGVYVHNLTKGSTRNLIKGRPWMKFIGGASVFSDYLYLSDYYNRVIHRIPLS